MNEDVQYDAHKMVTTVKRGREGGKYDSEKCDTENCKKKFKNKRGTSSLGLRFV